jgi:uncharacterized membrane protein YbhN (UPF0104 family)
VKRRLIRLAGTLVVTGLCAAYIFWKIDVSQTVHVLVHANFAYFAAAVAIIVLSVWPMAWRWQRLLAAKGIHDRLGWLVRAYFVAYTGGQVLPTAVGGDAVRIYETSRRHPGNGGTVAASVLLERALGGAATLTLAAVGFALAIGRYDVGAYLWVEGAFVVATVVLAVMLFSRRLRPLLARTVPLLRFLRVERPVRAVYEGIHAYRGNVPLLVWVFALTLVVQAGAGARDLADGEGCRRRPLSAAVLRDGPAPLPRPARTVHRQRAGGARDVLRQLPRQSRRQRGQGLCDRVPLLLRHDRTRAAGARDPRSGRASAAPGVLHFSNPMFDSPRKMLRIFRGTSLSHRFAREI